MSIGIRVITPIIIHKTQNLIFLAALRRKPMVIIPETKEANIAINAVEICIKELSEFMNHR